MLLLLGLGELYFPTKLHQSLAKNVRRDNGLWKKQEHWWLIFLYSAESASDDWPTARNPQFWNACAAAIAETTGCQKTSL